MCGHIGNTLLRDQKNDVFNFQGGVATGKSTVSNMLRELGIPVIDADAMARRYFLSSSVLLNSYYKRGAQVFPFFNSVK